MFTDLWNVRVPVMIAVSLEALKQVPVVAVEEEVPVDRQLALLRCLVRLAPLRSLVGPGACLPGGGRLGRGLPGGRPRASRSTQRLQGASSDTPAE